MKKLFVVMLVCLSFVTAVFADSDAENVMKQVTSRYTWLPKDETPSIQVRPPESRYRYEFIYAKSGITLQLSSNYVLAGAYWTPGEAEEQNKYAAMFTPDFIWSLRADLPRQSMVELYKGCYYLKRADGIIDSSVMMCLQYDRKGVLNAFTAANSPIKRGFPAVTVSEAQARAISQKIAAGFVYSTEQGDHITWPYVYEQHPEWAKAAIKLDSLNLPFIGYDFTYRLGDKPNLVFDDTHNENTLQLPVLMMRINASTGDVVYTRCVFYLLPKDTSSLKTDKPASRLKDITVTVNSQPVDLAYPAATINGQLYVAAAFCQNLINGKTVTAKPNAKVVMVGSTKIALQLPAVLRKGVLYLPLQTLNKLPGVKAQYDAKQTRLDITTAAAKGVTGK